MKKRLLSFTIILALILTFLPIHMFSVRAASETAGSATLTIITGVDYSGPVVMVNKTYPFEENADLASLFEAAKEAGDISDYSFSGGYIASITPASGEAVANAADFSYYWANYKNGAYAQGATDCTETDVLTDGVRFQFSYESYPTNKAPDDWSAIEAEVSDASVIAGSGDSASGSATLKIVKGVSDWTGANVLASKTYSFSEGATLGDLFAAAKEAGDIDDYAFTDSGYGSYISSITAGGTQTANKSDYSAYWANYKNGTYASGATDCTEKDVLTDGVSFEFSWEDYPARIGLAEDAWNELSAAAEAGNATAKGDSSEEPSEEPTEEPTEEPSEDPAEKEYASGYAEGASSNELAEQTEATYAALFNSLSAKTEGASDWYALCAAAIGSPDAADKDSAIAAAVEAASAPSGTNLQSSILILTALGVDVTQIDDGNGGTLDLLDILANTPSAIGGWAESAAYTLLAYGANPEYGISEDAPNAPSKIIALLKNSYMSEDGGFGWGKSFSADTTGAVIAALSCYSDNEEAVSMMKAAVAALKNNQNPDGGFGYAAGAETNVDSTALAIIGLAAAGEDPAGSDWTNADGDNPLTALLSFANEDASALDLPEGTFIEYTESDAFRALVAYSGFRNTGSAYNVYTMAAKGNAAYKAPEKPSYKIILIENLQDKGQSEWKKGSSKGILIVSDADFEKFADVLVDGVSIDKANYIAASGSTEITLKPEFLETLSEGRHTVTIVSSDGKASAEITVAAADSKKDGGSMKPSSGDSGKKSPKTGEPLWPSMIIILALISAAVCAAAVSGKRHE